MKWWLCNVHSKMKLRLWQWQCRKRMILDYGQCIAQISSIRFGQFILTINCMVLILSWNGQSVHYRVVNSSGWHLCFVNIITDDNKFLQNILLELKLDPTLLNYLGSQKCLFLKVFKSKNSTESWHWIVLNKTIQFDYIFVGNIKFMGDSSYNWLLDMTDATLRHLHLPSKRYCYEC